MQHANTTSIDLYAAFVRVGRGFKRLGTASPVDGPTLGLLYEIEQRGPLRPSDLASCVGLDASTVSRHVAGLERLGYVDRATDPEDRRATRLVLTGEGADVLVTAMAHRSRLVNDALAGWSDSDQATLERLLHRLADDLHVERTAATASQEQTA